jgi:predicted glycosyltransferase/nucleoside-diphosphate-sugar epimerase
MKGKGQGIDGPRYRAVVTGAAGFIGSHLAQALLSRGHRVIGIDSFTPYYPPATKRANVATAIQDPAFELLVGDLNELNLDEILEPADMVFHLAAQPGVAGSWDSAFPDYSRNNIEATQRLLASAHRRRVARVIYASSSSVYGDARLPMAESGPLRPVSPYGVTKLTAEQLVALYRKKLGLSVVPLRLFNVYGPRQRPDMAFHRFIAAIAAGKPITVYGDGRQRRDFTYVADVVETVVEAATRARSGVPVNVGGGSCVSVRDAIAVLEKLLQRRAQIESCPVPPGDARDTQADTRRLSALGLRTRVKVEEGLALQVAWQLGGAVQSMQATVPSVERSRLLGPSRSGVRSVMLYSHDTYGLGHLRRNTAIAHALLTRDPHLSISLITGSSVVDDVPMPAGIGVIRLPSAVKVGPESYQPAQPGRSISHLVAKRSGILAATLLRVRPDVFLVDHAPLGMKGELTVALEMAREILPSTRVVLGLRDILDDAEPVIRLWQERSIYAALENLYDRILVYGCRELFDVSSEYSLPAAVARRVVFTGYIAKDQLLESTAPRIDPWPRRRRAGERRLLVTGGGGGDAVQMFDRFLEAWPALSAHTPSQALLVTGPLMGEDSRRSLRTRTERLRGVELLDFSPAMLSLLGDADLVVCMGGYNSLVEAVTLRKRIVCCPRVTPRREQLIRANIMAGMGLATVARLDQTSSHVFAQVILGALEEPPPAEETWNRIDLDGAARVADELLGSRAASTLVGATA